MLLDNTLVDFHRGGWNPLEVGIGVQVDVVEAEVVAWTEGEAPLAVGGDAPADVDGYVDALAAGTLDFAHVVLDVFRSVKPVGGIDAAVLDQQDFLVWEELLVVFEHSVQDARPDRGLVVVADGRGHELLDTVETQRTDAPVVVEADEVLLAHALRGADKLRQFSGHAQVPPVAVDSGREGIVELEQGVEEAQRGANQ